MDDVARAVRRWVLFTGGRLAVSAALLFAVFLAIVAIAVVRPLDLHRLVTETPAARRLFTALLRGAILLASIVVSINSIVLSQEISDVETQRQRVEGSVEYRERIEELIDAAVTPTRPADFLAAILTAIEVRARTLRRIADEADDAALARTVDRYTTTVCSDVEETRTTLGAAGAGTFDVLLAGMNYGYADQLTAARAIQRKYGAGLTDDGSRVIDDLVDTLEFFAVGREYFKSLYYERELARLSTQLLAVSLPVIVVTSYVVLALGDRVFPSGSIAGVPLLLLTIAAAYTVALAPFAVLMSYVFRLSAITLATLAAGPFVVGGPDRREEFGIDQTGGSRDDPSGDRSDGE